MTEDLSKKLKVLEDTIYVHEQELKKAAMETREIERRLEQEKEEKIESKSKVQVYTSDDYAGMECKKYNFYFGYEHTYCKKHGNDSKLCSETDCDNVEWAFVVEDKKGKELFRLPESKLITEVNAPLVGLVHGIGQFLNK